MVLTSASVFTTTSNSKNNDGCTLIGVAIFFFVT